MELCNFLVIISCTTRVYNLSFLFQVFHFYCPISFGAILFFFQLLFTILVSGAMNAIFLVKFAIFDTCNSLIYTAILE